MLALLLMLLGGINVSAMETYDFQELCMALGQGGPWAVNDGGDAGYTIGDATMHFLGDYEEQGFTWNQRFAYEYVEGRGKFTMRNKSNTKDKNCGMFSWDYAHYFSVLGLKNGDKVTITIPTGTVTFVSENVEGVAEGDAVTTNQSYTITADGETRLDIQMAKASLIAKIVIEPYGEESVPVITLSRQTLKLVPGATSKLTASVDPSSAATQWKSDNEAVATVAEDGTVTAIAAGTANIVNFWASTMSDATASAACEVTVADVDLNKLSIAKTYDFTTMGDVELTLQDEAAGAIWNAANNKNNNVFFCTNEGLENVAVQAVLSGNKGWSIVDGKGLYEGSGAGRCAAIGGIKAGQVVEFIYTGDAFYTSASDDGIEKEALNEATGRAIYKAGEDGMIGFELIKGNYVEKIVVYEASAAEIITFEGLDYEVTGSNIVVNGSFDDGVAGWYAGNWLEANAANYTLHADGGFDGGAYVQYSAGGAAAETNLRNKWQLEKGKYYLFRCYTSGKTPTSNNFQYSFLAKSDDGATEGAKIYLLTWGADAEQVNEEWCKNEVVFKAESDWLLFRSSWTSDTKLDGFSLNELSVSLTAAKALLQSEIDAAEELLSTEGYDKGIDELEDAIAAAKATLGSATSPEELNAAVEALQTAEQAFREANMFSYQKYIVQNVGASVNDAPSFWGSGNDWGTRASLVPHPEYVKLVPQPDGKYYLESQVNNGGTQYYFNGDYMDNGSPVALTVTRCSEPLTNLNNEVPLYPYTIANGTSYYGWDGTASTVLGKNLNITTDDGKLNAQWIIIPLADAKAALAEATPDTPMDATLLIEDHDFGRNNRYANRWTVSEDCTNSNLSGGNNINNCAESYHSVFTISQKLSEAPAGDYELTAQGFYRQDGEDDAHLPVFFANDHTAVFPAIDGGESSMSDASVSFSAGKYTIEPIKFTVTEDGDLTIGVRLEENTNLWCIFDNFVLTYFGSNDTDGINDVKATKQENSDAIYNLQGQRVTSAQKGLHIQNGKKFMVK